MNGQGCKQPQDRAAYATGVTVLAIDTFDETGDGAVGQLLGAGSRIPRARASPTRV